MFIRFETRRNCSASLGAVVAPLLVLASESAAASGATGTLSAALVSGDLTGNALGLHL